ncbi:MAG: PKD domain-containing protein [Deltaproteobacteria bacterium]|nr:PKD domain-containing protein [Deltaproteobacteria bacterium]
MSRLRALTLGSTVALFVLAAPRTGAATPCSVGPCAVAEVDVAEGPAPLTVTLTGANSLPMGGISWYSWNLGDGIASKPTQGAQHTYVAPGGYTALLTVEIGGQQYQDTVFISVTTTDGVRPPRIDSASTSPTVLSGQAPFAVFFHATAAAPDGGAHDYWRLGIGDPILGADRQFTYGAAGSYVARFESIGDTGLRSLSRPFVVAVSQGTLNPPQVTVTTDTPAGPPPLHATLSASMQPDDPTDWTWDFGDGRQATGADVDVFYELPGTYWASVVGTHSNGLKGYDSVRLFVTEGDWPAAVVSVPVTRACVGDEYRYAAAARGTPTVKFTLTAAPTGMVVDENSGAVAWTPTVAQKGTQTVTLRAANGPDGTTWDEQHFEIEVSCCTETACPKAPAPSSCAHVRAGAGGTAGLLALVIVGALLRARRRR